ncbi:Protein BIG GRAIN 1-like [Actinidia chinensis var. chinensis]|uniref:Protein BIG GRAIN 1-like n=1 Tax=Actinidia chinensis var. chinensis TaxID=1590841 RepID=A0A2R6QPA9_ACTCC|nr:Protein BIG GRAIN 1-like [Actinidia chinensis var. chinensis]
MYSWEKSLRGERVRRNPPNPPLSSSLPSFSSTLLDEIYRSIDTNKEKCEESKFFYKDRIAKMASSSVADEDTTRIRRASMIGGKVRLSSLPEFGRNLQHPEDPLFFSSSSSSSDSSFGGFSSSDTEFSCKTKSRTSCFTSTRPKPEKLGKASRYEQSEHQLFDEFTRRTNKKDLKKEDGLVKSKLKALKIYDNLKKMKQPISPGGKLAAFLNSLFTNGNTKQTKKKSNSTNGGYEDFFVERKSKSSQASTCSSVSSYSRPCLTKNPLNYREKPNNGVKRTVRFFPVSVIVDEDCRPCGHKSVNQDNLVKFGPRTNEEVKDLKVIVEKSRKIDFRENEEDEYGDAASDSSSDLFELDHLAFTGNNSRYCEDLPVYETTRLDMSRAIASGLVR